VSGFPPDVSVVIPTYNRVDRLRRVLDALEHQTYPHDRFEVVVVSDGSTDGTDAFLESVESTYRIRWFRHPNAGPGATRNRGVSEAQGALVLFVDDDIIATPPLVARHVADHERLGPGHVVIGPMLTPDDGFRMSPWIRWEQAMLYKQYDALERGEYGATDRQFYTGNASVGRRELLALGGFDVTFRRAEDVELARRMSDAGLRFAFDREAIGYHYAERSFTSWLQIARDYGANEVAFAARFGEAEWFARVHHEYGGRHPLVRAAVRLAIVHPALGRGVEGALKAVTLTSARVRPDGAVTSVGLSGLYNVAYFRGMAAALGGASALRRRVVRGRGPRSSAP
jgi:glycosyltransferase involved in cell wall biosynthesis